MPSISPKKDKSAKTDDAATIKIDTISTTNFTLMEGEGSRNYLRATATGIPSGDTMPFLLSRDGKLYVRKTDVPVGTKRFIVTVQAVV